MGVTAAFASAGAVMQWLKYQAAEKMTRLKVAPQPAA